MENIKGLMKALVDLFYPLVEATYFSAQGELEEILNSFSAIKEDQACDIKSAECGISFDEHLSSGRQVKSLIYPSYSAKKVTGYIRLRYDLTIFKNFQEQLNTIFSTQTSSKASTKDTWKAVIDQVISQYLQEKMITIQAASARHKREIISALQEQRLLDFKEASSYVAAKIQTSRATVYNYMKTSAHLKKVHIHQVDAFTDKRFGGNPAGVVTDAEVLDEVMMRKIAKELNVSETAFILPSKKGDFRLRYFTPTGHEIVFCGHSTVGALFMLAHEKRLGVDKPGTYAFDVETLCGILKMEATVGKEGEIGVAYEAPPIRLKSSKITHEMLAEAAGIKLSWIDTSYPVMYESTNKDLYITMRSLDDLKKVQCDVKSLTAFSKEHDIVAFCLLTPESFDANNQFHMRCFAPLVGIPEDPFTGSVLGGFTEYVHRHQLLPKTKTSFRVEQGHFIERPGVVEVKFSKVKDQYKVKVLAQAVHCFSTELNLT